MALAVDLFGRAEDGTVVWRWMARLWRGHDVLDLVAPPPSDPPPSWEGPITREQIDALRAKAGGPDAEKHFERGVGLDELLATPVREIVVRVEEWGYG